MTLKFTWYDHLKELEHIDQYSAEGTAKELSAAG
jgi:hypothetical protein